MVAVLLLARSQNTSTAFCHGAIKNVLRYIRGTTAFGVIYWKGPREMQAFVDSDDAGDTVHRKSMTGCFVKFAEVMVMWVQRSKQR